jgi:hypothetical protein
MVVGRENTDDVEVGLRLLSCIWGSWYGDERKAG